MRQSRFQQLLKKYSQGKASKSESYIVETWYESFKQTPALAPEEAEAVRQRLLQNILHPTVSLKWYRRPYVQLAAAVLAGCAIITPILLRKPAPPQKQVLAQKTVHTGEMQIRKITLPDSSIIWLNANSTMVIAAGFNTGNREITLQGEAFFEVYKNTVHPFVIDASGMKIKVLGTSFNVKSYDALKDIKVAVNTGKVQVSNEDRQLAVLTPGQSIAYDKQTRDFKLASAIADNSWKDGRIMLEKASFEELSQALNNRYGIHLSSNDKHVKSFRYHLTLQPGLSEDAAMEMIATMLKKRYKKEDNHTITIY